MPALCDNQAGSNHILFEANRMQCYFAALKLHGCVLRFGMRPLAQQLWQRLQAGCGMLRSREFPIC